MKAKTVIFFRSSREFEIPTDHFFPFKFGKFKLHVIDIPDSFHELKEKWENISGQIFNILKPELKDVYICAAASLGFIWLLKDELDVYSRINFIFLQMERNKEKKTSTKKYEVWANFLAEIPK